MDFNYIIFNINNKDIDIFKYNNNIISSPYIAEPLIKYGFYRFQHQSKDKLPDILSQKEFKDKTLHLVTNPFEHFVIDNKQDIIHTAIKYFNLKSKKDIINRSFFILWELLINFDIINDNKMLKTLNMSNNMALNQCISFYRNKFYKSSSNNDVYNTFNNSKMNIDNDNNIEDFGSDSEINNINIHKNYNNITDINIINNICKEFNESLDVIVTDINILWKNHNYQEQESFITILSQIYCSLNILKKGGNLVLKTYESYCDYTIKLILILSLCFENVYITKPLLSRPSNSERYIVCLDYKSKKTNDTKIKQLYEIIEKINKTKNMYIIDIYNNYKINDNIINLNKMINTNISNFQFRSINEIMTYLKNGNYFGDDYTKYLESQTKANDYWISMYFPMNINDLNNLKKILNKKILDSIKLNQNDKTNKIDINDVKETKETKEIKEIKEIKDVKKVIKKATKRIK